MNVEFRLFGNCLYHWSTEDVFFHWLTFVAFTSSRLISSRICLLIRPTSVFDELIHRQVGLFAKLVELVGCYLLSQLKEIPGIEIGLYRDDGLAVLQQTPKATEKIKKEICKILRKCDLKITIEANKKVVNFLDVT